jgi:hypothetical protein
MTPFKSNATKSTAAETVRPRGKKKEETKEERNLK